MRYWTFFPVGILLFSATCAAQAIVAARGTAGDPRTEFRELIGKGRYAFFNEEYDKAQALLRAAQVLEPEDPETYEHTSLVILFELKKKLGITGDGALEDTKKLAGYADDIAQFESEISTGGKLAVSRLEKHLEDQHALFLQAKLRLNLIMFRRQVQNTFEGILGEYRKAKPALDEMILRNPSDCRALVAQARINYEIGSRHWYERLGLRAIGVSGDKEKGIRDTAEAAVMACPDHFDSVEARFSFLSILIKEKKWHVAAATALELNSEFPGNTKVKEYLDLARSKAKTP